MHAIPSTAAALHDELSAKTAPRELVMLVMLVSYRDGEAGGATYFCASSNPSNIASDTE